MILTQGRHFNGDSMSLLISFLSALNTLTPLAVIGLLVLVLFYQSKNNTTSRLSLFNLSNNHLSGLPDMAASLERMETILKTINDNIVYIRARMNGRDY
jgi:hypothetical protein